MKAILHRLNIYNVTIAVIPLFILFFGQSIGISTRHFRYIEDYRFKRDSHALSDALTNALD
jgi:hypothetical protein